MNARTLIAAFIAALFSLPPAHAEKADVGQAVENYASLFATAMTIEENCSDFKRNETLLAVGRRMIKAADKDFGKGGRYYDRVIAGGLEARSLIMSAAEKNPRPKFCAAMWAIYGTSGSLVPELILKR